MTRAGRGQRTAATVLVLVGTAITSTACSSDDVEPLARGPLNLGQTRAVQCVSGIDSADFTFGNDVLGNPTNDRVVIREVRLVGAHGLSMVGGFLTEPRGLLVGATSGFPPPPQVASNPASGWAQRTDAQGAIVPSGQERGLVVHLRATSPGRASSLARLRVDYSIGKERYSSTTPTSFEVKDSC